MGATGAIIMGFFAAIFAMATLALPLKWTGPVLGLPFLAFLAVAIAAVSTHRLPGAGLEKSERAGRIIMWSSIGEGIGIFLATNIVVNMSQPEMLLPVIALVVGLHFVPMAVGVPFRPFYLPAVILILVGMIGLIVDRPAGQVLAGGAAASVLMVAAVLAVRRERRAKLS